MREEMSWFMNKSSQPLFSFQNICDALRLDAGYLRKYLMQRSALIARQFLPGSFSRCQNSAGPENITRRVLAGEPGSIGSRSVLLAQKDPPESSSRVDITKLDFFSLA